MKKEPKKLKNALKENTEKVNCLSCKHYALWDGDPCCVHELKIVIPDVDRKCDIFERCNDKLRNLHKEMWNEIRHKWLAEMFTEVEE